MLSSGLLLPSIPHSGARRGGAAGLQPQPADALRGAAATAPRQRPGKRTGGGGGGPEETGSRAGGRCLEKIDILAIFQPEITGFSWYVDKF